ncbi:hypothetical protein [Thermoactinospora rubra]|uniref:hypothetical protein n=1 Tax=Thermoactinospora rubra TaxID=1088767 RepID=UPI000A0FE0EB|nr:hypothetical protein [Thermoactinospora rubra]
MSHPYTSEMTPAPLTEDAAQIMRGLLEQAVKERQAVADRRASYQGQRDALRQEYERRDAALAAEIDAQDTLGAELDATITRYRQRLGHTETARPEPYMPQTGMWAPPPPQHPNNDPPAGYCVWCGNPVWREEKGLTHAWGPTCNPDSPDSSTADIGNRDEEAGP